MTNISKSIQLDQQTEGTWRKETIQELIQIATGDLESCKAAYKKRLYPQSITSFQQSVEKSLKAYALFSNPKLSEKDLKYRYSHDPLGIYEDFIKSYKDIICRIEDDAKKNPQLLEIEFFSELMDIDNKNEFEKQLKEIERVRANKKKIIHLTSRKITTIIRHINHVRKAFTDAEKKLKTEEMPDSIFLEGKRQVIKWYETLEKTYPEAAMAKKIFEELDAKPLVESVLKPLTFATIKICCVYYSLYYLACVTFPHAIISRYPQDGIKPTKLYTNRLPVVKMLPELIKIQKTVLDDFTKLIPKERKNEE